MKCKRSENIKQKKTQGEKLSALVLARVLIVKPKVATVDIVQ